MADGSCKFIPSPSRLGPDLERAFSCEILLPILFPVQRDVGPPGVENSCFQELRMRLLPEIHRAEHTVTYT